MTPKRAITLCSVLLASFAPLTMASAETFSWSFASADVTGSGTLTATPYGQPGEYLITDGTGSITTTDYGTVSVVVAPCTTPDATCTLVNTDHHGANLTYDDLLFPNNPPGSELDSNGVVFTPGPDGTDAIGVYDMPSQEFFMYGPDGYENLTTPFTVTPAASSVTPEPSAFVLLGSGLLGMAGVVRRRLS